MDEVVFGQDEYPQCEKDEGKHDVVMGLRFEEQYGEEEIRVSVDKRKKALL